MTTGKEWAIVGDKMRVTMSLEEWVTAGMKCWATTGIPS